MTLLLSCCALGQESNSSLNWSVAPQLIQRQNEAKQWIYTVKFSLKNTGSRPFILTRVELPQAGQVHEERTRINTGQTAPGELSFSEEDLLEVYTDAALVNLKLQVSGIFVQDTSNKFEQYSLSAQIPLIRPFKMHINCTYSNRFEYTEQFSSQQVNEMSFGGLPVNEKTSYRVTCENKSVEGIKVELKLDENKGFFLTVDGKKTTQSAFFINSQDRKEFDITYNPTLKDQKEYQAQLKMEVSPMALKSIGSIESHQILVNLEGKFYSQADQVLGDIYLAWEKIPNTQDPRTCPQIKHSVEPGSVINFGDLFVGKHAEEYTSLVEVCHLVVLTNVTIHRSTPHPSAKLQISSKNPWLMVTVNPEGNRFSLRLRPDFKKNYQFELNQGKQLLKEELIFTVNSTAIKIPVSMQVLEIIDKGSLHFGVVHPNNSFESSISIKDIPELKSSDSLFYMTQNASSHFIVTFDKGHPNKPFEWKVLVRADQAVLKEDSFKLFVIIGDILHPDKLYVWSVDATYEPVRMMNRVELTGAPSDVAIAKIDLPANVSRWEVIDWNGGYFIRSLVNIDGIARNGEMTPPAISYKMPEQEEKGFVVVRVTYFNGVTETLRYPILAKPIPWPKTTRIHFDLGTQTSFGTANDVVQRSFARFQLKGPLFDYHLPGIGLYLDTGYSSIVGGLIAVGIEIMAPEIWYKHFALQVVLGAGYVPTAPHLRGLQAGGSLNVLFYKPELCGWIWNVGLGAQVLFVADSSFVSAPNVHIGFRNIGCKR